jgi:hypothetical protein
LLLPFAFRFCAQDARALLFPGTHGLAAAAVDQAPQGAARGIAPIPLLHRMCNQRNPADDADLSGRMPERRKALGRVSLVPFFARAKKGTRSAEGRVEAFALKRQNNQKQKLDSSFRWNDERKKGAGFPPKIRGNDKHRPLICQTFQPDPRQNYADIHPATSARLSQ